MTSYMTKQRKQLYSFLAENADKRFTAKQAAEALAKKECGNISLSAVYRNLAALERDGLITRSVGEHSREILYQYVHSEGCRGKIHLTCTSCGGSLHMDGAEADRLQKNMEETLGFEIDKSKTVLYGICGKCRKEKGEGK